MSSFEPLWAFLPLPNSATEMCSFSAYAVISQNYAIIVAYAIILKEQHEPDSHQQRKRQGLTQTDLADLCGVSLTFISNLENGKPTAELAKALTVLITLGLDVYLAKRGE